MSFAGATSALRGRTSSGFAARGLRARPRPPRSPGPRPRRRAGRTGSRPGSRRARRPRAPCGGTASRASTSTGCTCRPARRALRRRRTRVARHLADVRDGTTAAASMRERTHRMRHRAYATLMSPRPDAPPVAAELDRDVDRRAEQREQRDHERPAELDREQRDALVRRVADVVGRRRRAGSMPGDDEDEQEQRERARRRRAARPAGPCGSGAAATYQPPITSAGVADHQRQHERPRRACAGSTQYIHAHAGWTA